MPPQTDGDYKKLLSDLIRKQIIIIGPTIAIAKARSVQGLIVNDEGMVTDIQGNPQQVIQQVIEKYMELSGLIVRKTMEPLLSNFPGLAQTMTGAVQAQAQALTAASVIPTPAAPAPVQPVLTPAPQSMPEPTPVVPTQPVQPTTPSPMPEPATQVPPTPVAEVSVATPQPAQPPTPTETPQQS